MLPKPSSPSLFQRVTVVFCMIRVFSSAAELVDAINVTSYFHVTVCAFLWLTLEGALLSLVTRCIFSSTVGHCGGFGGKLVLPEPLVLT